MLVLKPPSIPFSLFFLWHKHEQNEGDSEIHFYVMWHVKTSLYICIYSISQKIITHWTYRTEREMCKQYSSVIIADRKTAGINLQSCALCGSLIDLVLTPSKQKLKSMFFEHPNTLSRVLWQEPFKHSQTLMCVFMWWFCWTQSCGVNLLSFLCEAAESFCLRMKYRGHPHSQWHPIIPVTLFLSHTDTRLDTEISGVSWEITHHWLYRHEWSLKSCVLLSRMCRYFTNWSNAAFSPAGPENRGRNHTDAHWRRNMSHRDQKITGTPGILHAILATA